MVDAMSQIMIGFLPISKIAIRGFTWRVMQNWQTRNQTTMESLHTMSLDETVEATKEMLADSRRMYKKLLWNATPEQLKAFEKGFDELFHISIKMIKETR